MDQPRFPCILVGAYPCSRHAFTGSKTVFLNPLLFLVLRHWFASLRSAPRRTRTYNPLIKRQQAVESQAESVGGIAATVAFGVGR